MKFLVVDDEKGVEIIFSRILAEQGYEIRHCSSVEGWCRSRGSAHWAAPVWSVGVHQCGAAALARRWGGTAWRCDQV